MLANMTNNQPEEWSASPRMRNQPPSMQGPSFNHFPSYRRAPSRMLHAPLQLLLRYSTDPRLIPSPAYVTHMCPAHSPGGLFML